MKDLKFYEEPELELIDLVMEGQLLSESDPEGGELPELPPVDVD